MQKKEICGKVVKILCDYPFNYLCSQCIIVAGITKEAEHKEIKNRYAIILFIGGCKKKVVSHKYFRLFTLVWGIFVFILSANNLLFLHDVYFASWWIFTFLLKLFERWVINIGDFPSFSPPLYHFCKTCKIIWNEGIFRSLGLRGWEKF